MTMSVGACVGGDPANFGEGFEKAAAASAGMAPPPSQRPFIPPLRGRDQRGAVLPAGGGHGQERERERRPPGSPAGPSDGEPPHSPLMDATFGPQVEIAFFRRRVGAAVPSAGDAKDTAEV